MSQRITLITITFLLLSACFFSCKNKVVKEKDIVEQPENMDTRKSANISDIVMFALENNGKVDDSINLSNSSLVQSYYKGKDYKAIFSQQESWLPVADSLYSFIEQSRYYGLFPSDYNYKNLKAIRQKIAGDSLSLKDAALWSKADVMFTDAFFSIASHLHIGRMGKDSTYLNPDSILTETFFYKNIEEALAKSNVRTVLDSLEPRHPAYKELRNSIISFLDSANLNIQYTWVSYPYKDSLTFIKSLVKRLQEYGAIPWAAQNVDSALLKSTIRKIQKAKGLTVDGKFGVQFVRMLNNTDPEKFKRIAITLDRYKQLPLQMPPTYVVVNLAGYYLKLWDSDTVVFESKVVVGKPATRSPVLTSAIYNMITYPQWTIPNSIILKEILPALKKSPDYLEKKGYILMDSKNELVDPYSVNWAKYSKGIPYKIVQGSGDDNALGVLKFNFNNKYAVYLHDTNQRYYFSRTVRSLSHGCIRVQEWQKLAYFILNRDSLAMKPPDNFDNKTDSLNAWLLRKEKHTLPIKNKLPLYIRYFTCDGRKGKVVFYDDIYGEDKVLREKYFANKN
ncbi:MAG: L,D-transpeptidase family protein [Sphingobacteriales bacterium]